MILQLSENDTYLWNIVAATTRCEYYTWNKKETYTATLIHKYIHHIVTSHYKHSCLLCFVPGWPSEC